MINRTFPLENFEIYVHRDILGLARKIYEGADLPSINRRDQLTIMTIEDGSRTLEVEVEIVRRKVRNYSCDCQGEDAGLCEHIAVALIHLKEHLVRKNLKKKQKKAPRKTLTSRNLLSSVGDQELRDFVAKYLAIDPKFSLALKTRFAHRVTLQGQHNHQKYYHLLRNFWKIHRTGSKKRSENDMLKYLQETLALAGDLLAQNEIREVFSILFGVLKFVALWSVEQEEKIREFEKEMLDYLTSFFAKNYSPVLKSSHIEEVGDLLEEYAYQPLYVHRTIYHLLAQHGDSQQKRRTLYILWSHFLNNKNLDIFSIYVSTSVFVDGLDGARSIDERHLRELRYVRVYLHACKVYLTDPQLATLCDELYQHMDNLSIRNFIYRFVLELKLTDEQYRHWLRTHFDSTNDFEVLHLIKKSDPKSWRVYLAGVRENWKASKDTFNLARSYDLEDEHDALFSMLEDVAELDTIIDCMGLVPASHEQVALDLVYRRLIDYLGHHVGYPSVVYVSRSLQRITAQGKESLARKLEELLIDKFKDRKLLRRELQYL